MDSYVVCVLLVAFFLVSAPSPTVAIEPYGMCQTGCNVVTMACYAAAGVVFGAGSAPACSAAQGTCMTACAGATVAAAAGGVATGAVTGATVVATVLNPVTLVSVAAVPVGKMLWNYFRG